MDRTRKVVMLRRKPDGTYERIDAEPSMQRPRATSECKRLRELAAYGNTVCRIKDGSRWAELRCVPAGTYMVGSEQITVPETHIIVTKSEAFLFDSHRYARELKMWQQENPD